MKMRILKFYYIKCLKYIYIQVQSYERLILSWRVYDLLFISDQEMEKRSDCCIMLCKYLR